MSNDLWCGKCGRFTMYPPCTCKTYKVKRLERGYENEEPEEVYGFDPQSAAEKWAEEYDEDSGERCILNGLEMDIEVISPDGSAIQYSLSGETVPQYHAREKRREQFAASNASQEPK